jgi:hypothetical protein
MAILNHIFSCLFCCVIVVGGANAQSDTVSPESPAIVDSLKPVRTKPDTLGIQRQPRQDVLHHLYRDDDADKTIHLLLQTIHSLDANKDSSKANVYREDLALHMQPVFSFIEHFRLRTVNNFGRHLLAAMGRQTM